MSATPFYETSRKEDPEDYRPVSVTLVLGSHGADHLECIIGQVQDNQVIGLNQNGSVKGRCCLTSLIFFVTK